MDKLENAQLKYRALQVSLFIALGAYNADSSKNVLAQDETLPTSQPADAAALTRLLETRYDSEQSYDYWECGIREVTSYALLPERGTLPRERNRGRK